MRKSTFLFFVLAILAFIGTEMGLVAFYLSQEETFHFWDYAMYANMAIDWFSLENTRLSVLINSLSQNYNLLFALPSLVSFSLFGASRFVFILTNVFFYVLLCQIGLSLLARHLFRLSYPLSFVSGFVVSLFIPAFWIPLLEGYPDHASAACFLFACFFLMKRNEAWKHQIIAGILFALSIIFRRHFAYSALAFIGAAVLEELYYLYKNSFSKNMLWPFTLSFARIGFAALLTLALIEPPYLYAMLTTNFSTLYSSYQRTFATFLTFLVMKGGALFYGLALYGYGTARHNKNVRFVGLGFLLWVFLWGLGPTQLGDHYLVGPLSFFLFVGFMAALLSIRKNYIRIFIAAALMAHIVFVFSPRINFPLPSDPPQLSLLAQPRPPWQRTDLDALKKLALYIKETTTPEDHIAVVGSSFVFNQDLLQRVYIEALHDYTTPLRFIPIPEADGQQDPPFNVFASANVYIMPDKPQYHLPPQGQKVITSFWQVLNSEYSFFKKEPFSFTLMNDVKISVIRRPKTWPPSFLHQKLKEMRQFIDNGERWVIKKGAPYAQARGNEIIGLSSPLSPALSFFYDKPLDQGDYMFSLSLEHDPVCQDIPLTFEVENKNKKRIKEASVPQNPGIFYYPFSVTENDSFFSLSLSQHQQKSCRFHLSDMVLSKI